MAQPEVKKNSRNSISTIIRQYLGLRSTIYGRVVMIITLAVVILFVIFLALFRTVFANYFNIVLKQSGNNVGMVVEGALYNSMLTNDERSLQSTIDLMNTMPGIEDVNLYDEKDNLAYSSFSPDEQSHSNPDCIACHTDLGTMFSRKERSYRIIDEKSDCSMNPNQKGQRQMLIRRPVLNEMSCYTASCHAHSENDEVLGSLIIRLPLNELDNALKKSSTEFLLVALLTTILIVATFIYFTRKRIKDPLNSLIKASEAVSAGELKTRIDLQPGLLDDMQKVSLAFNNMLDHIDNATNELENWSKQLEYKVQKKSEELSEAQNELINVERIASLGKLSSSVAHEINNPLSGILVYTKLVYKQLDSQDLTPARKENILRQLKLIESETKRCGDIVKGLLDFSRKDQDDFEEKNLNEIVKGTYEFMTHHIKIANISFIADFDARDDLIFCSPGQIKQACVALLVNASEAIGDSGEIVIRTKNPDSNTVRLEISDNGSGISPDDIPHIFEPFFSTKREARGIGLGLAIVHGIIQNHGAKIEVNSTLGKGTTISINFPLRKA
jgi:two-component system NtrC family sensor kinase